MKTIEIRALAGVLVLLFGGGCCVFIGIGPDIGLPKIPYFYSALYSGPRWIIVVGMLFGVPVATTYLLVRYGIHTIASSGNPFLPPLSWHQTMLAGAMASIVLAAWLFVLTLFLSIDFGN